jgi:hypothetical protein
MDIQAVEASVKNTTGDGSEDSLVSSQMSRLKI